MKNEHRMGKGEWSYLRDWQGEDDAGASPDDRPPPYKAVISALIEDEVTRQVEKKLAAMAKVAPQAASAPSPYRVVVKRGADHLISELLLQPTETK